MLTIIRHGETTWNAKERFAGLNDVPHSEKVREQARTAGTLSASTEFERVFTSRLQRAVETVLIMKISMKADHLEHHTAHEELNERRFAALEGPYKSEAAAKCGKDQM